jgi:hypothetical protein
LPAVWQVAEQPIIELIVLLLAPNSELRLADKTGQVDNYLAERSTELLHTISFDEITGVVEVLSDMIGRAFGGGAAGEAVTRAAETAGVTTPLSTSSSPTSSGSSGITQAGSETQSSTEPLTSNLSE